MSALTRPVFFCLIGLLALTQAPRALQQQPLPRQTPPAPDSTFRAGVNFVRADVYVTRDGAFVPDLTRDDFELVEDGAPQRIEKIDLITAATRTGDVIAAPRTLAESRTLIETSRGRLFVVFLDTFHVDFVESMRVREPLSRFLNRAIGADDLVAIMTPDMSAADLSFERRGESAEQVLARRWPWGMADTALTKDPIDDRYRMCYPGLLPIPGCATDTGIAAEMIARRHEKHTLDAFDDLVGHLETLREERKSIVTLSRGWLLYRPDDTLARPIGCRPPPLPPAYKPPPTGVAPPASQVATGGDTSTCEGDRRALSALDNARQFRDMTDRANRANVTFYTLDPRGAVPFDEPIATPNGSGLGVPSAPLTILDDRARLAGRQNSLRDLAASTDGVAILNQDNLDAGFSRIAKDVSGYYLLGYYSTGKLDGRFHNIRVRVKRPGLEVRSRRGYLAPTQEELTRGTTAPGSSGQAMAPSAALVTMALAGLSTLTQATPLRVSLATAPASATPMVWLQGELDPQLAPSDSDVSIVLADGAGNLLATGHEHLARGTRSFRTALTPNAPGSGGQYVVRVRWQSTGGDWDPLTATESVTLAGDQTLAGPLLNRRGPSTGNRVLPTVDRRFRRSEQLIAEVPLLAPAGMKALVLDRNGGTLPLPVTIAARRDDAGVSWLTAQVSLSPLGPGDYVLELRSEAGPVATAAFRIVQ